MMSLGHGVFHLPSERDVLGLGTLFCIGLHICFEIVLRVDELHNGRTHGREERLGENSADLFFEGFFWWRGWGTDFCFF